MKEITRDKKHLEFIRGLPCLKCSSQPCDASHIRRHTGGGMGIKPSDEFTLSLCREHHMESHRIGELRFFKDIWKAIDLAKSLYAVTGDKQSAIYAINTMRHEVIR